MKQWQSALERLKAGNQRFTACKPTLQLAKGKERLESLAKQGQAPFAVVLSCSDSRVPIEWIFDQGVGELFVVRVAGGVAQSSQIASIEYAVQNLKVPLLLIMGHSGCGAVQAAIDCEQHGTTPDSNNLSELVELIRPSVQKCSGEGSGDKLKILEAAIQENVKSTRLAILENSPLLRDFSEKEELRIVEAYFQMDTGMVKFSQSI